MKNTIKLMGLVLMALGSQLLVASGYAAGDSYNRTVYTIENTRAASNHELSIKDINPDFRYHWSAVYSSQQVQIFIPTNQGNTYLQEASITFTGKFCSDRRELTSSPVQLWVLSDVDTGTVTKSDFGARKNETTVLFSACEKGKGRTNDLSIEVVKTGKDTFRLLAS